MTTWYKHNRCDQCEAAVINGVYCHETGCPNTKATTSKPGPTGWKPSKRKVKE